MREDLEDILRSPVPGQKLFWGQVVRLQVAFSVCAAFTCALQEGMKLTVKGDVLRTASLLETGKCATRSASRTLDGLRNRWLRSEPFGGDRQ